TFTDVTKAAGIHYRNFSGVRTSQLPEDMGSGVAWGDYDGDGWVDLVVANEAGPLNMSEAARRASPARAQLYHNNHDGTFTDVTDAAGIDFRGWGMAASWADYDGDGRLDLLLTAYGHNVLYHNESNGRFADVSASSGIGAPEGFWTGAAWGDYDRDGRLDLYITGYVNYQARPDAAAPGVNDVENPASINPASFPGERNLLFHNDGNGHFTERAKAAGVDNPTGRGLSAVWADFDGDGWPDLYVGNDVSDNVLYRNRHDGTFEDITHAAHIADYRSSMGIAVGDWNGDGRLDLYLTHWIAQGNALYVNVPPAGPQAAKAAPVMFVDESDRYGLGQVSLDFIGWGTSFVDYDLDGRPDLFVVNGSTLQTRSDPTKLGAMRSQLFWNRNNEEGFFEVSPVSGEFLNALHVGRGVAFADFDNDGDVDAFVTTNGGEGYLLRNDGGNANHWLQVALRGATNTQGIGATLRVVAGGRSQVRQVGSQASYLSQSEATETFGLGALAEADTVEVTWIGGAKTVRTSVRATQRVTVEESGARAGPGAVGDVRPGAPPPAPTDRAAVQQFWALMRQATDLRVAGSYAEALPIYMKSLALNPTHGDALYYAGTLQLELGDFTAAEASWRRMLATDPHSARALSQMGALFLCLDRGAPLRPDSADKYLRAARDVNRENTGPLLHLGESALIRRDRVRALEMFRAVLATHQSSPQAHFYAGYIAFKAGDEAGALREFQLARAAPPAAAVAGATNEGDTRTGAALRATRLRCGELEALAAGLASGDAQSTMRERYGRLDALLAAARPR
ncbi:MAG: FG-GAP-like repeat-containing protein, partial [Gemmatimonadota bacterium]|nr:FG-GAP-like repeat-containing protein [Gemmatimonadota bacterium]